MENIPENSSFAGRAKTALVYSQGNDVLSFISSVVVHTSDNNLGRVHLKGPVSLDKKIADHVRDVILPACDIIVKTLQLPLSCFEISVVNLEVASMMDVGSKISGFSADVPIFLAVLSAALQMDIPEDIVSTGHIASIDGDIRMVSSIPVKLSAAVQNNSIRTFIYPDIDQDDSLASLSPKQRSQISGAVAKAKSNLRVVSVKNVKDLLTAVFSDRKIVKASLQYGFYSQSDNAHQPRNAMEAATGHLIDNNEIRFWASLEQDLFAEDVDSARELLELFAQYFIDNNRYPQGFGSRLLRQIRSIPPHILRHKIKFPLLSMPQCIQLSQFVRQTDHEDVSQLFLANSPQAVRHTDNDGPKKPLPKTAEDIDGMLNAILAEIDQKTVLQQVSHPIDTARATFMPGTNVTSSINEFDEIVTSFYIHLQRHTYRLAEPVDLTDASKEAFEVLQEAFAQKGGEDAARIEAETGINGGIRFVLDMMTEYFKHKHSQNHINYILKSALKPLEWKEKVGLTRAILNRLKPNLPQEVLSQPEKFTRELEDLLKTYVQSQDKLKSMLRSY